MGQREIRLRRNGLLQKVSGTETVKHTQLRQPFGIQPRGLWARGEDSSYTRDIGRRDLTRSELLAELSARAHNQIGNLRLASGLRHGRKRFPGLDILKAHIQSDLTVAKSEIGTNDHLVGAEVFANPGQSLFAVTVSLWERQVDSHLGNILSRNGAQLFAGGQFRR